MLLFGWLVFCLLRARLWENAVQPQGGCLDRNSRGFPNRGNPSLEECSGYFDEPDSFLRMSTPSAFLEEKPWWGWEGGLSQEIRGYFPFGSAPAL